MEFNDIAVDVRKDGLKIILVVKCCAQPAETGKILRYLTIGIEELIEGIGILICNL